MTTPLPAVLNDMPVEHAGEQVLAAARQANAPVATTFRGCIMMAEPHWDIDRVLEVWQFTATHHWVLLGQQLEKLHAAGVNAHIGTRDGQWFVDVNRMECTAAADAAKGLDEFDVLALRMDRLLGLVLGWDKEEPS
jgi:hypothetical protein